VQGQFSGIVRNVAVEAQMNTGSLTATRGKSGHRRIWCRLTTGQGDLKESATENIPPKRKLVVRVKWCGKSAPRVWRQAWQGKPHLVKGHGEIRWTSVLPVSAGEFLKRPLEGYGNVASR